MSLVSTCITRSELTTDILSFHSPCPFCSLDTSPLSSITLTTSPLRYRVVSTWKDYLIVNCSYLVYSTSITEIVEYRVGIHWGGGVVERQGERTTTFYLKNEFQSLIVVSPTLQNEIHWGCLFTIISSKKFSSFLSIRHPFQKLIEE